MSKRKRELIVENYSPFHHHKRFCGSKPPGENCLFMVADILRMVSETLASVKDFYALSTTSKWCYAKLAEHYPNLPLTLMKSQHHFTIPLCPPFMIVTAKVNLYVNNLGCAVVGEVVTCQGEWKRFGTVLLPNGSEIDLERFLKGWISKMSGGTLYCDHRGRPSVIDYEKFVVEFDVFKTIVIQLKANKQNVYRVFYSDPHPRKMGSYTIYYEQPHKLRPHQIRCYGLSDPNVTRAVKCQVKKSMFHGYFREVFLTTTDCFVKIHCNFRRDMYHGPMFTFNEDEGRMERRQYMDGFQTERFIFECKDGLYPTSFLIDSQMQPVCTLNVVFDEEGRPKHLRLGSHKWLHQKMIDIKGKRDPKDGNFKLKIE